MQDTPLNPAEDVISANECTGLVPALPMNDNQALENMTDLYAVLPPKKRNGKWREGKKKAER